MKSLLTALATIILGITTVAAEAADSVQVEAARNIHKLLEAGKFDEVYQEWCHPHLQGQVDKEAFVGSMKKDFGKGVIKLFAEVMKALDGKAGADVIVAQPQEDQDEYEFILTKVRKENPIGTKGSPWHIELKLHDGKWKLMDTD